MDALKGNLRRDTREEGRQRETALTHLLSSSSRGIERARAAPRCVARPRASERGVGRNELERGRRTRTGRMNIEVNEHESGDGREGSLGSWRSRLAMNEEGVRFRYDLSFKRISPRRFRRRHHSPPVFPPSTDHMAASRSFCGLRPLPSLGRTPKKTTKDFARRRNKGTKRSEPQIAGNVGDSCLNRQLGDDVRSDADGWTDEGREPTWSRITLTLFTDLEAG